MLLEVLGAGDAFCSTRYNTSFLLREPDLVLIDGPQALFRLLQQRDIDRDSLDRIILTHVHGDHSAGFETLMLWNRYALKRRLKLLTSAAVYEDVRKGFFSRVHQSFNADFTAIVPKQVDEYVDWIELSEEAPTLLPGGTSIEIRHNWHPAPTLGLRLSAPEGSIGISGDTCYRPQLLETLRRAGTLSAERYRRLTGDWLWQCDAIYHEASRGPGPTPHTLEEDLLELPADVRNRLRLVHLADDYPEGPLPLAEEGERIRLRKGRRPELFLP